MMPTTKAKDPKPPTAMPAMAPTASLTLVAVVSADDGFVVVFGMSYCDEDAEARAVCWADVLVA